MSVKIYVEGGGESDALRTACRRGFRTFFEKAGLTGRMPRIVACGSRNDAFDSFRQALSQARSDELPLLLVDSEAAVMAGQTPWQHLQSRDHWVRPSGADDHHVYLMVQCMEAWFLADPDTLASYFGAGFRRASLPPHSAPEILEKTDVMNALSSASHRASPKGEYRKGRDSFVLLGLLDPARVRRQCPGANRLIEFLESRP